MLEKLGGDAFVSGIEDSEFQGDAHEVEAIHCHPTGAVGLRNVDAAGQRGAVEGGDIVETQETALKDVAVFNVFAIDPPGEIQQQFVEDTL